MEILIGASILFGIFMLYAFIDGLFLSKMREKKEIERQKEREEKRCVWEDEHKKLHHSSHPHSLGR